MSVQYHSIAILGATEYCRHVTTSRPQDHSPFSARFRGLGLLVIAVAIAIEAIGTGSLSPELIGIWLILASCCLASLTAAVRDAAEPLPVEPATLDGATTALFLGEEQFLNALARLGESRDPLLRDLAALKLAEVGREIEELGQGRVVFEGTEGWRTAYERLLLSPDLGEYRSVAWAKTTEYWQDAPGLHSMQMNFAAIDLGLRIERIVILGWNLWPPECGLPVETTCRWLDDQHYRGINVLLVREPDLVGEPDLARDFGIYGTRAIGEQIQGDESRTSRFVLDFDSASIRLAMERWDRLKLFATSYSEVVDRAGTLR